MMTGEKIDLRTVMVETFIEAVEKGINLVVVVSDSTSTSKIKPFLEKYPDRLVNVGIAEQNLVGIATGLSLGGYVAVTANAAPFLVARANEQIKNDVCYSESNVKMMGLNAGVSYGALASTHHAIDDIVFIFHHVTHDDFFSFCHNCSSTASLSSAICLVTPTASSTSS